MIEAEKFMYGLSEPETERLMRVASWAFNKGRDFANNPAILETLVEINWKDSKLHDSNILCMNCVAYLTKENK